MLTAVERDFSRESDLLDDLDLSTDIEKKTTTDSHTQYRPNHGSRNNPCNFPYG